MRRKKHRVVIDTNLWIHFLLTKNYSKVEKLISTDSLVLLFSQELLDEFTEVASRPKFKKYFSLTDLQGLLTQLSQHAEFINVTSTLEICRDPKDNFLLSLSADGRATHLITGDKDLLMLKTLNKTKILTITDYLSIYTLLP